MKKPIIILTLLAFMKLSYAQTEQFTTSVKFDFNESTITNTGQQQIAELLEHITDSVETYSLELSGHTDYIGSKQFNLELSELRSSSVVDQLVNLGIDTECITSYSLGENYPVDHAQTFDARTLNRRVDIRLTVHYKDEPEIVLTSEPTDTTLFGPKGTLVKIPACAFNVPLNEISFVLEEVLNTDDMMATGTMTVDANGNCLSSGGMVFLRAYHNGKIIDMNGNCDITIQIPVENPDPEMNLYLTDTDSNMDLGHVMSNSKWEDTNQPLDIETNPGYYTFSSSSMGGFNCDKLIGAPAALVAGIFDLFKHDGVVVKTKGLKGADAYLSYETTNSMVKGRQYKKNEKKHTFDYGCGTNSLLAELIVVKQDKGTEVEVLDETMLEIKYSNFRNLYIVKKKDYKLLP